MLLAEEGGGGKLVAESLSEVLEVLVGGVVDKNVVVVEVE